MGANEGSFDGSDGCTNVTVILDFGQVGQESSSSGYGGYGAYDFAPGYPFQGDGAIGALVNSFANGWYNATGPCPHLELGVGVNSYNECPYSGCNTQAAGTQWGSLINNIRAYLNSVGQGSQITVRAADDIEAGYDCYSIVSQFLTGYENNNPADADLLDYGDAAYGSSCRGGSAWTEAQIYSAAYGYPADYPFPEIYYSGQITDWYNVYVNEGYMNFFGTLSQYPAGGYTPDQAWTNFYNALHPVDSTLVLQSSSDI